MNYETEQFYKNIKDKLQNYEYRIGLDIGVGSIGWCIVSLDFNKQTNDINLKDIIFSGVRVFTPSDGASDRRQKRAQRNLHRHKRERLYFLWKLLAEKKLALPAPQKLFKEDPLTDNSIKRFPKEVLSNIPYTLRYKALYEKISLMEIGYVIYHLANHRGSTSLRSFEETDEKTKKEYSDLRKKVTNTKLKINDKKYQTYGELIYKEKIDIKHTNQLPSIRNKSEKVEFIPTRDLILDELKKILNKQKEFYPEIFADDFIEKIINIVNFEYEQVVPEVGKCPYFRNENKLPKAHPLSEERRIWELLNNIRISYPVKKDSIIISYHERELKIEEKKLLHKKLYQQKELTKSKVKEILDLPPDTELKFSERDKKDEKLKGYRNIVLEQQPFWKRLSEEQKDSFFYDWINISNDQKLKNVLKEKYNLSQDEIDFAINNIEISKTYSPIGKTATKILLEYIKQGISFTEAIDKAIEDKKINIKETKIYDTLPYYGEILSDFTQPVICKGLMQKFKNKNYKIPNTDKNELKYGRIANPVVHQTLNELRKLVNEIIFATGKKPYEISLEISRDLRKSDEERSYIINLQNKNEKENQRIYEQYCKPHNLSLNWILKFKLFEQQDKKCPYCLNQISVDDIVNSRVDIDHIFPLSKSLDNSRNNLVLAHNYCNETKADNPPYNIFSKDIEKWNDILSYLEKTDGMKSKKWRFMKDSFENFLENLTIKKRFETDTTYIGKIALRYLSCLFDKKTKVIPYKSGLTAQLRLAWDLNKILIPYVKELLEEEQIEDFEKTASLNIKLKNDYRNHTVDAIVLAYATRNYSNVLNRISAHGFKIDYKNKNWMSKIFVPPNNMSVEDFSNYIKEKIKDSFISIKHNHDTNGPLLGETFYKVFLLNNKYFLVTQKDVAKIDAKNEEKLNEKLSFAKDAIEQSNNQELKKMLQKNLKIFEQIKSYLPQAEKILKEKNIDEQQEGKKVKTITKENIIKKALEDIRGKYYDFSNKEPGKFFIVKQPNKDKTGCGYDTGKSLCIDLFYNKEGKLCGEIVRKIDAMKNKTPKYIENGFKLFERIYQGDVLECDVSKEIKSLSVKTANAIGNRVLVRVATFTEVGNYYSNKLNKIQIFFTNLYKSDNKTKDSFCISSMQKYNVRKVILSSLGAIKYRSPILKDKNVANN